ncbi:MAG: M48 family metalloprotease [Candidatus Odinarchaeota archaeon]
MALTHFLKWFNFAVYVFLDILVVFICSAIPENIFTALEGQPGIPPVAITDIDFIPNLVVFTGLLTLTIVLQVVYFYYRLLKLVRNEEMFRIYPVDKESSQVSTARVPIRDIVTIIKEISEKLEVSVQAVYVSRQTIPELMSFDILPIPRKYSVMVLNETALEITSKQELRCLLTHELAHIKNHDSTIRILQRISSPFVAIAYFFPFLIILRQLARHGLFTFDAPKLLGYVLIFLTFIVAVFILTTFQSYFIDTANRQAAFAADTEAARLESKNATINMLVKLGQRSEALDVLLEEIMWLEKREKKKDYQINLRQVLGILDMFPRGEISEEIARKLAPEIYLRSRFMVLEKFYHCKVPGDVQEEIIREASEKLISKRQEEIDADELLRKDKEKRVKRTVDWREVDKDGNLNLDNEELKNFIVMLRENPSKLLFENEFTTHGMFRNYPSFRDRILHLDLEHDDEELVAQ